MVGMEDYGDKPPHHLSGGQQKRVAIAGIVAMRPEIMILDEPTAGLDPNGVDQVLNILKKLNSEGMSVVISSHDIEMVSEFINKIYVINNGEITNYGSITNVFSNHKLLKEAYLRPPKTSEILHKLQKKGLDVERNKNYSWRYL